jgi:type IV fimbrial biogenesis protein FimT
MKSMMKIKQHESGFTLIEVLVVIVIIAILAAIAIPAFSGWLPDYRLRRAARDLYSNLQRAKVGAIKANETWGVFFDAGNSRYSIWSLGPNKTWDGGGGDDESQNITIDLSDYEGVNYGNGNALKDMDGNPFGPVITYAPNPVAIFTSRGTVNITGSVYLCNTKGTAYAVATPSPAGVVIIRKHNGGDDWV